MSDNTSLGDRIKAYEKQNEVRFSNDSIIVVRLDGRGFHRFRNNFNKPFDWAFRRVMADVSACLVEEFGAVLGYSQSDEISMVFAPRSDKSESIFGGKQQKINSILASACTMYFGQLLKESNLYCVKNAQFDCRCFTVPSKSEAVNAVFWRFIDCVRNSVLAVAQNKFSHKEMQGINVKQLIAMLADVDDWNMYRSCEKYGEITNGKEEYHSVDMRKYTHESLIEFMFGGLKIGSLVPRS